MEINKALDKLFSLHKFGIKLGLENILNLLKEIGDPHEGLKVIHIAGSNGKGSTSSFIASMLMEAGFKVGLYTSPHFVRFNERIRIDGEMINDNYITSFVDSLEGYIKSNNITFFEVTTALAFQYFNERHVDYAVIETGLGGRLDATNVVNPVAAAITSISLEHTEHLGGTIGLIAAEKGGIIKRGVPLFTGELPVEAEKVISGICERMGSVNYRLRELTETDGNRLRVKLVNKSFSIYNTPLKGEYQRFNAALALSVINRSIGTSDGITISRGIKNVVLNSGISGRYEILHSSPKIILDSAHNPESVTAFASEFIHERGKYNNTTLLFAAMKDKAVEEMLKILKPLFDSFFITEIEIDRSIRLAELDRLARKVGIEAGHVTGTDSFLDDFRRGDTRGCLVILGSMYLAGKIKSAIMKENA
jgi:dihydrofolate synthase / folylpolyglutamate synthase